MGRSRCLTADIRLCVVELNVRAVSWYLNLGFAVVQLQVAKLNTLKLGQVPVVFLTMQRKRGTVGVAWEHFFTGNLCKEKVVLLPHLTPSTFRTVVALGMMKPMYVAIEGYNPNKGVHHLEDGRDVDLTDEFANGRLIFQRPLHKILSDVK